MVGEYLTSAHQFLDCCKKTCQVTCLVQVGNLLTEYSRHLFQARPTQAVCTMTQVDQQQVAGFVGTIFTGISQLRGNGQTCVENRCKSSDYQRYRCQHMSWLVIVYPVCFKGQGILAHRNSDAQCGA